MDRQQDEFSDVEGYVSDNYSDISFKRAAPQEVFEEAVSEFPRKVTYHPQETRGFGNSKRGPRPGQLIVANTGPAAGRPPAHREDFEPLYRRDARPPETIFIQGFQPKNNLAPPSLQRHQKQIVDSALVSFSRDPEAATGQVYREPGTGNSYRYTAPHSPGGVDVTMSLGPASYAYQQEVVKWKGTWPDEITRADAFDVNDELIAALDNPYASAEATAAQARLDQRTAQERVENATAGAEVGQASEYDKFCHRYAEWYLTTGTHSEHGHIDGHIRTYAEWWANNSRQPEVQEHAAKWNEVLDPQRSPMEHPAPPPTTQALYDRHVAMINTQQALYEQQLAYAQQQSYQMDPSVAYAAQTYSPHAAHGMQAPYQGQPAAWDQSAIANAAQTYYPSQGSAAQPGTGRTFSNVQYSQWGPAQQSQYGQQPGPSRPPGGRRARR